MSDYKPYYGAEALLIHDSSHDTLDAAKHVNWLANGVGQGIYVHGRIHQELGRSLYVGDLIHKRGFLMTDDLLLMEEQATLSHGEPLSVNSSLGDLTAMAVLPMMGTANGEGSLIAYYQSGVVSFDTQEAPRETRHDGTGAVIQKGWDTKRLVNHLLNTISAVGRYAVAVLTRDHMFRSYRGLHFLKTIMGDGTFKSENVNRISLDVDPILQLDPPELLSGAAVGFWTHGDRMFATTGLVSLPLVSASSVGRGFVSWNQAYTFTEDYTPKPLWEGLWTLDSGMAGAHRFLESTSRPTRTSFGFMCSDMSKGVYFASIDKTKTCDTRDGVDIPIEWSFETAQYAPGKLHTKAAIKDCTLELVCANKGQRVRVLVRSDSSPTWVLWRNVPIPDKEGTLLFTESLGAPPQACREVTWVQLRVEGIGPVEIRLIDLDFSETVAKAGRRQSYRVNTTEKDFFETNSSPPAQRW